MYRQTWQVSTMACIRIFEFPINQLLTGIFEFTGYIRIPQYLYLNTYLFDTFTDTEFGPQIGMKLNLQLSKTAVFVILIYL